MTNINIRNPIYTADNRIDCEIEHPQLGWIPFTADPDDVEQHGRDIYAAALAAGPAAYVPPPPQPEPIPDLSFAQLMIGLVSEGWITTAEGESWLTGTLPAPVLALIGTLPEAQRFPAKARALRPTIVERTDPLVSALGLAQGKSPEQLDTFFQTYAAI
jgi:hypothetical protein